MTVQNLLFCAHTLCMNYVINTFLLVRSRYGVNNHCVLCTVKAKKAKVNTSVHQSPNPAQPPTSHPPAPHSKPILKSYCFVLFLLLLVFFLGGGGGVVCLCISKSNENKNVKSTAENIKLSMQCNLVSFGALYEYLCTDQTVSFLDPVADCSIPQPF